MNIDIQNVLLLTQKEMLDAGRNRWFILFTLVFTGLSLALSWMGLSGVGQYGLSGFGRTTASMINMVLLIVPLMGLTLGAISLAGERERGTLLYLLAQPLSSLEVLLGKYLGVALSLLSALVLGFGVSGFLIAWYGGTTAVGQYLTLIGLTFLLALVSLGVGVLISTALPRADAAVGISLFVWLALVFFGDLGVMGTALTLKLGIHQLFALSLINPLQVFKLAAVLTLQGNLEVLGPVGVYAMRTYGAQLLPLLVGLLILWIGVTFFIADRIFKRRGAL
ncbi:MAG: ABC transporter permease [Calditrichaeota bacterium]|nr:MAG: ABC transporter permease [Calditrichota bacterium]